MLKTVEPFCISVSKTVLPLSFVFTASVAGMDRPSAFSHHRFIGDKRTQQVYDLDEVVDEEAMAVVLDELMASDDFLCFGPDSIAEARNRGYRLQSV